MHYHITLWWKCTLLFDFLSFQEEWINQSIYDLIHPEDRDKLRDQLGTEITHESRILDPKSKNVIIFL